MTSRSALVLGGTGFVGRHLVRRLLAEGWDTTSLLVEGRGGSTPARDVSVPEYSVDAIRSTIDDDAPDVVFNLAATGVQSADRHEADLVANVGITAAVVRAAAATPDVQVVHTGTWSEYAPSDGTPLREGHSLRAASAYGAAKAGATITGLALAKEHGVGLGVMRLFHTYGPGEADHRLLPYLVSSLGEGRPADLTSGRQVRDFVHIDDAVDALLLAGDGIETGEYNVATGVGTSVQEVAHLAADALGADRSLLRFGTIPDRGHESPVVVGDGSLLEEVTGWRPKVPVSEGVPRTIEAIMNPDGSPR